MYGLKVPQVMNASGGYRIQNEGSSLVSRIEGDYGNVVGLPLNAFCNLIIQAFEFGWL